MYFPIQFIPYTPNIGLPLPYHTCARSCLQPWGGVSTLLKESSGGREGLPHRSAAPGGMALRLARWGKCPKRLASESALEPCVRSESESVYGRQALPPPQKDTRERDTSSAKALRPLVSMFRQLVLPSIKTPCEPRRGVISDTRCPSNYKKIYYIISVKKQYHSRLWLAFTWCGPLSGLTSCLLILSSRRHLKQT